MLGGEWPACAGGGQTLLGLEHRVHVGSPEQGAAEAGLSPTEGSDHNG